MFSHVTYINNENYIRKWPMGKDLGLPFESRIYKILSKQLGRQYGPKIKIWKTEDTQDNGKDIIIQSETDLLNFMGRDLYLRGRKRITIYIECKSSDDNNITFNQLAGNASRVKNDDVQYYILVTNTTIVPFTFYNFNEDLKKISDKPIEFMLVDQTLLFPYLRECEETIGDTTAFLDYFPKGICGEYQILTENNNSKKNFKIYLLIRNYSEEEKITISLGTDHDWSLTPGAIDINLGKNEFKCIELNAERDYNVGIDKLNILFKYENEENIVEIQGLKSDFDFDPPMFGKQHNKLVDTLCDKIFSLNKFCSQVIVGEAGCGKTKIINSFKKKMYGTAFKIIYVACSKNDKLVKKDIVDKAKEEQVLQEEIKYENLSDIINQLETDYFSCTIILDDIHNLSITMIKEIKELITSNSEKPVLFIMVGRNDFSEGISEYYSFLQWCNSEKTIQIDKIKNLTTQDASALISAVINDVPEFVKETLITKSHCNPLFIIQFIEYLLQMKIAHVVNRTTVGILNVDNFREREYIPDKIDELYKKRCNQLKAEPDGKLMVDFLYLASFIGHKFVEKVAYQYFDGKLYLLENLVQKKFLLLPEEGKFSFYHETLYLFLRKQMEDKAYIWKKLLKYTSYLTDFQLGEVYLHSKDYDKSLNYFQPIIAACDEMQNYTATSINPQYYKYLDSVLKLQKIMGNTKLQKKIVLYKIYTALHYFSPILAAEVCTNITKDISEALLNDKKFMFDIRELKAHSYLNAGRLKNSERYLNECLTMSLIHSFDIDKKILFDMYDRLSGLYIKYNHLSLAENYNILGDSLAKEINAKDICALSAITKAKIYLYLQPEVAEKNLKQAKELLQETNSKRILAHAELSWIIQQLPIHQHIAAWIYQTKEKVREFQQTAIKYSHGSSIIRSYLLLAVLDFLANKESHKFEETEQFLSQGIDASIKFGIATYIWEFYNMKLIIRQKLHYDCDYIMKLVETIKRMLMQQNLLYLGSLDFCYANILVLTNIARYYKKEGDFYKFMNSISCSNERYNSSCNFNCGDVGCQYVCEGPMNLYKKQYKHVHDENGLLLVNPKITYDLLDEETGYYIAIS